MARPNIMKPETGLFDDEGDRWMRSLTIAITCGDEKVEIDGHDFEEFVLALGIRRLAVHWRTRDVLAGSMPGDRLSALIDRNWSSIDTYGLNEVTLRIQALCRGGDVRWSLA